MPIFFFPCLKCKQTREKEYRHFLNIGIWSIEVFFRESKRKLALDKYQVRTRRDTERYWLIMSLVHLMCCSCKADGNSFESGYQHLQQVIRKERVTKLYISIHEGMLLDDVLQLVG